MNEQVAKWCNELKILPEFAKPLPQATYAAFYFGERNRFSYFLTQRKTEQLTNLQRIHQRLKQTWIMIQKERSVRQKNRVLLAG